MEEITSMKATKGWPGHQLEHKTALRTSWTSTGIFLVGRNQGTGTDGVELEI